MHPAVASRTKVLFLSTQNSARSQMAEAFLRLHGGERFEAYSAGLLPGDRDPLVTAVMRERGISLRGRRPKSISEYRGRVRFDYVVTVCGRAERRCPDFAGMGTRLTWPFEDPAAHEGPKEKRLERYREVRDAIERFIVGWLATVDTGNGDLPEDELRRAACRDERARHR